jgi:hypothetical protein
MTFKVPESARVRIWGMASTEADGNNGAFICTLRNNQKVNVIASDGAGWEHVSVSRTDRIPTWNEMCEIKYIFWGDDDCVVQYHPAKEDYINCHPNCLHLWKPIGVEIPCPPSWMVGYK